MVKLGSIFLYGPYIIINYLHNTYCANQPEPDEYHWHCRQYDNDEEGYCRELNNEECKSIRGNLQQCRSFAVGHYSFNWGTEPCAYCGKQSPYFNNWGEDCGEEFYVGNGRNNLSVSCDTPMIEYGSYAECRRGNKSTCGAGEYSHCQWANESGEQAEHGISICVDSDGNQVADALCTENKPQCGGVGSDPCGPSEIYYNGRCINLCKNNNATILNTDQMIWDDQYLCFTYGLSNLQGPIWMNDYGRGYTWNCTSQGKTASCKLKYECASGYTRLSNGECVKECERYEEMLEDGSCKEVICECDDGSHPRTAGSQYGCYDHTTFDDDFCYVLSCSDRYLGPGEVYVCNGR